MSDGGSELGSRTSSLRRLVALAAVPVIAVAACGGEGGSDDSGAAGDGVGVVASFYPIAEAAARVGGDLAEVTNLTPAGTEPHDLELSPDQVDDLEDADVVFYLGHGFQPAVAEATERRDGTTVDLLDGIDLQAGEGDDNQGETDDHQGEDDHGDNSVDPHFWLDPRLMADAVGEVEAALVEAAPGDAEAFAVNAREYEAELDALDREMESGLAGCERDEIVTSHAAFHYLARRYGLTQVAIAGLSPETEPDADRLAELADQIEADGVTTVFYETLVSPDVAETLAREAGVETAVLNPLEGLTDDQAEAGDDYVSVMRDNLAALRAALGCGE
jgi:zinc transport system substrate-binding protein